MMKPSSRMHYIGLHLVSLWMLPGMAAAFPADTTALSVKLESLTANGLATIGISSKVTVNIRLEYQLLHNGVPGHKGVLSGLYVSSRHASHARLPLKMPPGDEEIWLRITCRRTGARRNTVPIATALLPLRSWHGDRSVAPAGDLVFTDSNDIFTITAPNTQIQFDKQTGWLLHYEAGKMLLMGDTAGLQPTLWPGAQPRLQLFSTSTGSQLVIVRAEYTLPETWSLLHMSYTINAAGDMLIGEILEADTSQHLPDSVSRPLLPRFGMRWLLPAGLDTVSWLGSADSAAAPDISRLPLAAAAVDPRETSHPDVRWLTITGAHSGGLRIIADSNFFRFQTSPVSGSSSSVARTALDIDLRQPLPSLSSKNIQCFFKATPEILSPPAPPNGASPSNRHVAKPI